VPGAGPPAEKEPGAGHILFFHTTRLGSVRPDGKDLKWYPTFWGKHQPGLGVRLDPDGKRVVYGVQRQDFRGKGDIPSKLYVRALDGKGQGEDLGAEGIWWFWSPDGKQLVVMAAEGGVETGTVTHWLVDVGTRKKTVLKVPKRHLVTDWSPDGKWLLTTYFNPAKGKEGPPGMPRLHLVKPDGSASRALTAEPGFMGRFSPDGKKVAYLSFGKGTRKFCHHLSVVDVASGKSRRLTEELNAEHQGFCWSPDGRRLAYAWRRDEEPKGDLETESFLVVVDADGQNAKVLLTAKFNNRGTITLASPDWR
jgi:Tol biopolymer transport system component